MTYEEKRQARIDRLRARAATARQRSSDQHTQADKMLSGIPLGQPILMDHYSARRDMNYRAKIWRKMDRAVEEAGKAAYYEQRADAAEKNDAIFSEDPQAIEKLEQKLAELKAEQAHMKGLNAHYRKHKTCVGFEGLSDETARKFDDKIANPRFCMRVPFPPYCLSNNNANIHRVEDRLAELRRIREAQADAAPPIVGDGFQVLQNAEACRVQFLFDAKPDDATRALLKANGFRWAPSEGAWQRLLNQNGIRAARYVAQKLNGG